MLTPSDMLERYHRRQVLKSVAGYLTRSVERTAELVADVHQDAQKPGKNLGNKRQKNNESTENAENTTHSAELAFPDRRKQNVPVLLDTRSKRSIDKTAQQPFVDITV